MTKKNKVKLLKNFETRDTLNSTAFQICSEIMSGGEKIEKNHHGC